MIALILFTHEVARARQAVSEPMLAAIRLQWWREALDEIFSGKPYSAAASYLFLKAYARK
jgi:phytoene synthase